MSNSLKTSIFHKIIVTIILASTVIYALLPDTFNSGGHIPDGIGTIFSSLLGSIIAAAYTCCVCEKTLRTLSLTSILWLPVLNLILGALIYH